MLDGQHYFLHYHWKQCWKILKRLGSTLGARLYLYRALERASLKSQNTVSFYQFWLSFLFLPPRGLCLASIFEEKGLGVMNGSVHTPTAILHCFVLVRDLILVGF